MARNKKVLLGVTGSIAAYKAADIIRDLGEKGVEVSVVMTKEAESFITSLTLSSLAGKRVYTSMWDESQDPWQMPHIRLAEETDLILIAPATANIIGKIANGIADDLLTCIVLATKAKLLIAPAMNTQMYKNVFVQENCRKLKEHGVKFIDPVAGKLACGVVGEGHLADENTIVQTVMQSLK